MPTQTDIYRLGEVAARKSANWTGYKASRRTIRTSLTTKIKSKFRRFAAKPLSQQGGDFVICHECFSSSLRLSRVRWKDVERLLLLQYPVRCQRCQRRDYAGLHWVVLRACKVR
jgi:hypothetical protein